MTYFMSTGIRILTAISRRYSAAAMIVFLEFAVIISAVPIAKAGEIQPPEISLSPKSPEAGPNEMVIRLKDEAGLSISDASIEMNLVMPAMATMPRMETKPKVEKIGGGKFRATYDIPMQGTWEVSLRISTGTTQKEFSYSLTTGVSGLNSKSSFPLTSQGEASVLLPIGPDRLQKIGVKFVKVQRRHLQKTVRAVGVVEPDNTTKSDIVLRYSGYVEKQFLGRVGDHAKVGTPLFSVYSPDLVAAQSEFLIAHNSGGSERVLHASARDRLKNLGLSDAQIARIIATGSPLKNIVISAPVAGTVLAINISEGSSFGQGQLLYTIGDLSKNFIVARIFQRDIGGITAGMPVSIKVPDGDGATYSGKVDLIYPNIGEGEGTANVRVQAGEHIGDLRPGNYVELRFGVDLGEHLSVPTDAILYSGLHKYVFVDRGAGNLEPKEVVSGRTASDWTEIKDGLRENEQIVSSGAFLISSEAQLRSALPKWRSQGEVDSSKN